MTISDDLFRAILAMDAYNRGYGAGINFGPGSDTNGTQIGNATISGNAETLLGATQVQAASGSIMENAREALRVTKCFRTGLSLHPN